MAALPYMQLYVADYLADTGHLTTEEHGAYLLLLFSYWQTGKPLRANRLASVARMQPERWKEIEPTIREFFHVAQGEWVHFRVEADLESVANKQKKNSEAGKASAKARALAKQALAEGDSTDVPTDVEQTYQRNVNHTDTDTDTDKEKIKSSCDLPSKPRDEKPEPRIDYASILKSFQDRLPALPQPRDLTDTRKKKIRSIVKRGGKYAQPDFFDRYFKYVSESDFLMGRTAKPWNGCCIDWLINPTNFQKIVEGNYHKDQANA